MLVVARRPGENVPSPESLRRAPDCFSDASAGCDHRLVGEGESPHETESLVSAVEVFVRGSKDELDSVRVAVVDALDSVESCDLVAFKPGRRGVVLLGFALSAADGTLRLNCILDVSNGGGLAGEIESGGV